MASVPLCASLAYGAILAFAGLWDGVQMGGLAIGELNRDGHSIDQSNHVRRRRTTIERRNNSQGAAASEPKKRKKEAPKSTGTKAQGAVRIDLGPRVVGGGADDEDDDDDDAALDDALDAMLDAQGKAAHNLYDDFDDWA